MNTPDRFELCLEKIYPEAIQSWQQMTVFHSARWCEFQYKTLGISTQHAVIKKNEQIVAYLPFHYGGILTKKLHPGPAVASYAPSFITCDGMQLNGQIANTICSEFAEALAVTNPEFASETCVFNLPITDTFANYWANTVHTKARYDVRKSDKANITTEFNDGKSLHFFYELYWRRMQELGSPALPRSYFETMAALFAKNFRFAISFVNNRPVAASTLLSYEDIWLCHPWSVSATEARNISANYGHYRDIIKFAFDNAYKVFYLGSSLKDSNWSRIKKRFGGIENAVVHIDGRPKSHASQSRAVKMIQTSLNHMPAGLYKLIAPSLARLAIKEFG